MKNLLTVLAFALFGLIPQISQAQAPHKVLVVLSSENKITLRDGIVHPTGFFLSELMVPVIKLMNAGFEPVFANPQGNQPTMDKVSDSAFWFGGDQAKYQNIKNHFATLQGFNHPLTLAQIRQGDLSQYAAIFLPGGHAPMEDLSKNSDLGFILKYFHSHALPTALICHAPIALLSTLDNADQFTNLLANKSLINAQIEAATRNAQHDPQKLQQWSSQVEVFDNKLKELSQNWIYKGYELTAFSTKEEQQEEITGTDGVLGGFVKFYPDEALGNAGANTLVEAIKWTGNVRIDRELITGQNPFSDELLGDALVKALSH